MTCLDSKHWAPAFAGATMLGAFGELDTGEAAGDFGLF